MRFKNLISFALFSVLAVGCGKKTSVSPPVVAAEAPKAMEEAFKAASVELRQEAVAIGQAASQQDPAAVSAIEQFLQRPDLTAEQRQAAGRVLPAALAGARQAAARGDASAAQALEKYKATK